MINRDQVSWQLQAPSTGSTVISVLTLSWPTENGSLFKVDLGGATIWVGDLPSPAGINSWTGGETSRIVEGEERLAFRFKSDARAQGYDLEVLLSNSCQIQIHN